MGSSDLFPEKFALYFSSMNPLASKIYSEIESVQDFIKCQGPSGGLSYSEKCSVVDKFLIYDHLDRKNHPSNLNKRLFQYQLWSKNKQKSCESLASIPGGNFGGISDEELIQPVFYGDNCLDNDHESVLLTSVAPKKLDKEVFDEGGESWVDEHSGEYTRVTPEQAKCCKLAEFLEKLPPPPVQPRGKYKAPSAPKYGGNSEETESRYKLIDKKDGEKKGRGFGGVSVFGGGDGELIIERNEAKEEINEDDRPNQVKNENLIAELQAKLKNKSGGADGRGSVKINKPKAPPPPPPGGTGGTRYPGGAVKISSPLLGAIASGGDPRGGKSSENREGEVNDEFVVDVSSPCKVVTRKTGLDFLDNW